MSANLPAFAITSRSHPSQGSKALQLYFDMTAATEISGDLLLELENGHIENIQSVKIDNSQNAEPFTLHFPGVGSYGDSVIAAPYSQGTYPIFVTPGKLIYEGRSGGGAPVTVTFFNIELPYVIWQTVAPPDPTPTVITGTETGYSGNTTAAVSKIAIADNPARLRAVIQNPGANNESIWVRGIVAATMNNLSQEIMPGQQFDTSEGPLILGDLNVISANAVPYFATEIHT